MVENKKETTNEKQKQLNELLEQRASLDKLIKEISTEIESNSKQSTNIPFSDKFIYKYPIYNLTLLNQEASVLLEHKLLINKISNQLSTNFEHTHKIFLSMQHKLVNQHFVEMLFCKFIDQGRILVTSHLDSYKPISYILSQICQIQKSQKLLDNFLQLVIRKECGNKDELGGIYALYFGTLIFMDDFNRAWDILASILNSKPNEGTGKVLETYFLLCGPMLCRFSKKRLGKILRYMDSFYFKMLCDVSTETRIRHYIDKAIKGEN